MYINEIAGFEVTVVLLNMVSKFTEATGDFESQIMLHFCVICHIQLKKIHSLLFSGGKICEIGVSLLS